MMFLCLTGSASALLFPESKTGRTHADWLQSGYDAAKTGATPDHGPIWDDLAFKVKLPGRLHIPLFASTGHIVVVDRDAYFAHDGFAWVLDANQGGSYVREGPAGIVKLNLDTEAISTFATFSEIPTPTAAAPEAYPVVMHEKRATASYFIVSNRQSLFAVTPYSVQMYDLRTGELLNEQRHQWPGQQDALAQQPSYWYARCAAPALTETRLIVACALDLQAQHACCSAEDVSVVAYSTQTLDQEWIWKRLDSPLPRHVQDDRERILASGDFTSVGSPTIIAERVTFSIRESVGFGTPGTSANYITFRVWALDLESGAPMWNKYADQPAVGADLGGPADQAVYAADADYQYTVRPTGDENRVCFKLLRANDIWECVRPVDGIAIDAPAVLKLAEGGEGQVGRDRVETANLVGDDYYIATGEHQFRFSWSNPESMIWYEGLQPGGTHAFTAGERIVSGDRIYAVAANYPTANVLNLAGEGWVYAFDRHTGNTVWRTPVLSEYKASTTRGDFELAIGGGVLIVAETSGEVTVFGETAVSPKVAASFETAKPQPGKPLVVDLGQSRPGAHGPLTQFRVDWGDATITDWDSSSRLSHVYEEAGSYIVKVTARNDAGQSSTAEHVVRVATPPGIAEQAFTQANQDLTFFILGLLITAIGAGIGLYRLRRRQRILKRELGTVDEIHARTAENRREREKLLIERRVFAKILLRNGDLDEPKYLVLERHIDNIMRDSRTSLLDERFDYLPHGMMKRLEQLLADGHVSAWEREMFENALAKDTSLSAKQKANVSALLRDWFAADAAAKASTS